MLWKKYPKYYWGDHLDVRYYLTEQLTKIRNKRILMVGCNCGVIEHFMDRSNIIVGIDNNKEVIEIAKKLNPHWDYSCDDFFTKDWKIDWDIIVLSHVLPKDNYQSDHKPEEMIDKCKSLLKSYGKIYLTTPNPKWYPGKVINRKYLEKLFFGFDYTIKTWNPFHKHLSKIYFISGIYQLLKKTMNTDNGVSYYVEATKND